jgi:subtilisin-like proprotein convertase family protein
MIAMRRRVVTGHDGPWVVLPTLLMAALLVGSAVPRPVAGQETNTLQCSSAATIVSGSSNTQLPIPDMGVASAAVLVPAFTGVYVQAIILTLSLSHPNLGDLAIVLATPSGQTSVIKPPDDSVNASQVNGAIEFYNGDCSEYPTLPPASQGGPGPFIWADLVSIWAVPGDTNIINGVYVVQVADTKPGGGTGSITGFEVKIVGQKGELLLLVSSPVQVRLLSALLVIRYQSHHSRHSPESSSYHCSCIRINS